MRHVGIDCRFAGERAGLGTYTRGIVHALLSREDGLAYTLFVRSANEPWIASLPKHPSLTITEAPFRHYSFGEQWSFPSLLRRSGCDLLFFPHFNAPLLCPVPFCITVHDLILHRYPNEAGFLKRLAYRFILASSLRRARCVFAVSEYTKNDVVRFYPYVVGKISVASPGIDPVFFDPVNAVAVRALRERYGLQRPFLLYIGNCKQHKNVPMLLEAFLMAAIAGTDLVLLCSGKQCDALLTSDAVKRISVDDSELQTLLAASSGLVTATFDEGFGLPMVEAMACGVPVLATRCGAIPEVCGEHALLVEPTVPALASGMRSLVHDRMFTDASRLDSARAWVRQYDWKQTATVVAAVFSSPW